MRTQQDHRVRVVALANLIALCERASGTCHRFEVSKVTRSRVHVTYSNPDEYGYERPVTAVFPCYPSTWQGDEQNPRVILGEMLRTIGGTDSEDWQYFDPIVAGLPLYRDGGMTSSWRNRIDINGDRYVCPDGITRTVDTNHPYTNDTFAAFDVTSETSAEYFARHGGTRHFAYFTWADLTPAGERR